MKAPSTGILFSLGAAVLFGLSTPLAKMLLQTTSPLMSAGLLYAGAGWGLSLVRLTRHEPVPLPTRHEHLWLAAAVVTGGIIAPVLLLSGLRLISATTASLLLNLESVFTALLAWQAFKEHADRRIVAGMLCIVAGCVVLAWPQGAVQWTPGCLLVAAACFCWGLDNNFTQRLSSGDPYYVVAVKGTVAGAVNFILALSTGSALPSPMAAAGGLLTGFLGYGLSLVWYVRALRSLGTSRTAAYFGAAPFAGALLSYLLLGDTLSSTFYYALPLMLLGVWLHLSERHEHPHQHAATAHDHEHTHDDEHHQHSHADQTGPHQHPHEHQAIQHSHPHYPDVDHRHSH